MPPTPELTWQGPLAREPQPQQLGDILERVLDKGIVIVGEIQVHLLDIELLTIKLRLVITSLERAREMGIDWWEHDAFISSRARGLEQRMKTLEKRLAAPASVRRDRRARKPGAKH